MLLLYSILHFHVRQFVIVLRKLDTAHHSSGKRINMGSSKHIVARIGIEVEILLIELSPDG